MFSSIIGTTRATPTAQDNTDTGFLASAGFAVAGVVIRMRPDCHGCF